MKVNVADTKPFSLWSLLPLLLFVLVLERGGTARCRYPTASDSFLATRAGHR